MQQDKQATMPSLPSRLSRRSSSIFRRPILLHFEEKRNRDSNENSRSDIAKLPTARLLGVTNTQVLGEGLALIPDTGISNEEMRRIPNGGSTHEGLHLIPNTNMSHRGMPQQISYDQLDERLVDELDFSHMSTIHLMQFSGMMRAIPKSQSAVNPPNSISSKTLTLSIYNDELLVKTQVLPRVSIPATLEETSPTPTWKVVLNHPAVKTVLGLTIGIAILLLLSRLIDFHATGQVLEDHLRKPEGILHACIGGLAFAMAFTLRGARWKLFLNRISNVSVFKVIRIYWIAVFINFLLPVQGGEVAKSVMLKKVANVPIPMSQSLPTVAMDKALDLMPVLGIIMIVPFIPGIHMNFTLWLILALVDGILVALVIIIALTAWKRDVAIHSIHLIMKILPKGFRAKFEGFGMGFVDSLVEGARRPKSFIPASLLTILAILCEGIFAWQVSQAVGLNSMSLGIATFGYTVFTMFSILPTPPGQVGLSEGAKALVFTSLLGFGKDKVLAMSILSHVIGLTIITVIGLVSLWSLDLSLSRALNIKGEHR